MQLHDEVGAAVGELAEVADVDDVVVADRRGALGLALGSGRSTRASLADVRAQELDREAVLEDLVLGLEH